MMLKEIAITPGVFERDSFESEEAWLNHLRELGTGIFPRTSVCPVVVSDLYDGSLFPQLVDRVKGIKCEVVRRFANELLKKLHDAGVKRPVKENWPGDDDSRWCREAIASHQDEELARVVSTRTSIDNSGIDHGILSPIEESAKDSFWDGFVAAASPRMRVSEQVGLLRTMTLHAHWIAIINPHSLGSEREFVRSLYSNACQRSLGFGMPAFEIHAEVDGKLTNEKEAERQARVVKSIKNDLADLHPIQAPIRVIFWPKFLDRYVVAGNLTSLSSGQQRKQLRWAVSMSHTARSDQESDDRTPWHLVDKDGIRYIEQRFFSEVSLSEAATYDLDNLGIHSS
ncbi:hypothetical protein [Novipirellula rosea]|uniref:hypothetical protein n=1 Tax=Novipirellula rosea TaxID=1031540 RepID=UPI0031ED28DC